MIDDPYAYEDESTTTWRNLALVAAVGVGAFVAWRWLTSSESGHDFGAKVREGFAAVKDRVDEWTGQEASESGAAVEQQPGYTVDPVT